MATPSHAAAVKSLNKSPGRRRFVYKSFSQLINDIDINVFRSLDKVKVEPSEGSSFFRDCLMEWRELNTAEDFISFYEEMLPVVQTLPLVLLHKEMIFSKLISRLEIKARLSLEPILRLIAALSRDLLKDFVPFLPRIADSLVSLLESGADREPEIVEQVFTSWSYIMMYLQKYLIRRIKSVLKETVKFRYYPKDYVREFIAEATSFLLRNAPKEQLEEGIKEIISEVVEIPSFERKHGASSLLCYAMRGTSSGLHSKSKRVLQFLMSSQLLSVGDDVNEVSGAAVEVVIGAFQNICDILGPKELNLIRECLYMEIKDAIAERYLLHLSRLLLLLVATLQIDNDCKFSDKGPLLELVDILVHKHLIPSDIAKESDHSSEVIDKVLKLMLCILDGLQETNDMLTISDCSLQWAPVFQLRNSSLLIFIRELLQRGPDVICTFQVHILSALDDLVETSQEEVTCLLLSFFEKLETSPQCNSFLNRMCDRGSRIHGFITETICWWIKVINDIVDDVSSVSQINVAKLSLLWGTIGCYPYIFDVQANSSLLMNLIDGLNSLLVTKAEINAGVPKSTWEGLIGAALSSYNKWHRGKKCGPEETEKVLHLARTCKSSSQVLLAVADYLDCVHGVASEANNSNKRYILELGKQKTVDAVGIFADNLCHSDKAIRVATLRIMCHYEPLTCESNAMDEPPEKKLKTETGVSYVCDMDNVIKLLFSIEATPLSISTSRKVILLISRIQMSLAAGKIPETYLPLVLGGMIGVLHNRFSYLWNPATECLSVLISKHVGLVWDKFISYMEQCQSKFHPASNRLDEMNSESANKLNGLLERFHLFISPESDSTPHTTVLSMLLQSLQKIPSVVESRSRQMIPLFLEFLGYNRDDLTSVGSFHSNSCKGKDWKSVLKEWLNLLKLMRNPKSFYMSKFLKDVLQNRFLDENDAEIQMKVLDCLLLWKDEYLFLYDEHLRNLINSKNLREELTTWSLSRESGLIEEGHRTCLVPLVIRLLMPKVRKLKTLASRKHTSLHHRKAVLGFMAQLDVNELPLFFLLLIKPLQIIPKEADKTVDLFWMRSYFTMEEFREINFLKYFTVENIAALSRKKIFGFLHVIEDILVTFDELHVKPFISLLMGCVVRVLTSCALGLEAAKDGGSSPVHLGAPLTLNKKDNTGDLVVTGSAVKQFKDLRSLCLKIISGVLDKYEDHDFGYGFWDLFFNSVKSLIDAFKQEGSSSEKPSSLFSCFLTMSRSEGLVSLLCREKNLVPDIFSILTVPTASEAIISSVLKFIESLLNLDSELDDEDSDIKKVVLLNLEPLVSSLHCRYQNTSNRKLVRSSTETELRIFALLSKYIKNPLPAQKFVDVLLPLFTKGLKDSEVALKALEVVRDIIPVVGTGSTKKILSAVSPLLVSAELDMRLCICDLVDALAKADPSVLFVAKLLRELNAISSLEMGDLDYDTIVNAYERIGIELFNTMEEDHALVILSQCVYDMSSEDIIRRHSAYSSLVSFVEFSSILLDQGKGDDINEETQTADEGCWTRASIQRMINKFLLKHMGEAMTNGSQIKKEWTDFLREMILKLPQLSNFSAFKDLCSGDAEVDFFNNIIHLQRHRKARALLRFKKVIVSSNVSGGLINKVFVPLFVNMLFDVQDENVRSACVEVLASISAYLEWKPYSGLLIRCVREMEKNPQKQKVLLRLFCAILDQFHFSQISSAEEAKDSFASVSGAVTNIARSLGTEIQTFLHGTVLPKIQKVLNSDADKVNVDVSRAILKLLKLLPGDIMDSQLSSVIHRLSNFLKSRADSMRNSARLALADCLRELGLEYLQFVVGVLRAILKRGYELHVLGYTLNFILSKCLSNPISGKLDYCLGDLLSVVEDDILGDVAEQKEVEKIASKMIETKKNKSFETLELVARNITFRTHAMKLLSVVTKHLQKHLSPKVKSRLESMLNHIAAGIECNPSVDQTDLFVFLYGLIEDGIKEENCLLASTSNTEAKKKTNDMKEKTSSSGRVIVSKSGGSHLITVFAIGLLHKRLKNVKPKALDDKQLSMLDSFLKLLGDCLSSKYEDVLSVTLRCLIPLISLPLPSLHSQADKIKTTLLAIAQSSVNSSSPLMQSCLSLLTKLLRSTKVTLSADQLHMLIQFPLFVDLERNPSDVALSLLKAIVSRKLVVHEIYDIVIQVAELMVTSQVESIRKKCSQILLQFLLDYHLSDKRLQQHLDLLLANLRYEHSSGREAVLEMLHAIIKKFPQSKLDEQSDTLFVRLVICLANDCNDKVRTMTATTIKLLIGRISPHLLQSILEYSRSWYLGKKQQLCSAGAQVLGLLVEVMKKDFQRHIGSILPVTRSILHSTVADRQPDTPDEATVHSWKESYYSLVLLEKIICLFPDLILARDLEDIWEATCELLLHPHTWLRNRSNRLIALYFSAVTKAGREHHETFFLMKPSRLFLISSSLCCQLEGQSTFDDAVCNRIMQNLVSVICNLHSSKEKMEIVNQHNLLSADGQHEQGLLLKAFQMLDSRKGKGIFLSIVSDGHDNNDQHSSHDFQYLLVSNLLKKMGKIALQKEAVQMKIIFNIFRLISSEICQDYCERYAIQMLPSLYKVCEGFAGKDISDDLKQLAQEVCDSIKKRIGSQKFIQIYNDIRKNLKAKRDKRKQEEKLMAVVNPMRNAKRKLRIAAKHRANKKRKMMTMKMARWMR